ncbi:uncharacterized protein LOC125645429 [Ostrea edulis]|uniref:uncharacterized protein LOC125645429 n=1 Tax=Ostrea edulis TaxID=37623 RepID=UPI0024AF61E3|nr:uncharacterized protein LOC125645429 [Ostrea edulis]
MTLSVAIWSMHHLVIAKVKIKLEKEKKTENKRTKYNVEKLRDVGQKQEFQIELRNRFEALNNIEAELDIDTDWEMGKTVIKETCDKVLGKKTNKMKDWMSQGTWAKIEERKRSKDIVNNAKTRQQKNEANRKYQEIDKEVKQHCRQDKRNFVNDLATEAEQVVYRGDIKTLYNLTKTLSNRRTIKSKPH